MVKKRVAGPERHRQGLEEDIENPWKNGVRPKPRHKRRKNGEAKEEEGDGLSGEMGQRIMREARAQQAELDQEEGGLLGAQTVGLATKFQGRDSDSDEDDEDRFPGGPAPWSDSHSMWGDGVEEEVTADEEAVMAAFLGPGLGLQQRTLADIILDKIREKEAHDAGLPAEREELPPPPRIDPKVEEVYRGVGHVMSRYTDGAVPKAFKIIPNLSNWEEVLYLTDPENWSPHAVFRATRMFVSNLKARMAQQFLALVLLPHVRQDIQENKRLHHALFQAMKKAAYKPDAFYKGLVLPLVLSGNCTLREAVIVSSVVSRVSLPVVHSAAALVRLAEAPYGGITSFFIRVLLEKKYALPYRAIDSLVDHFLRFKTEERVLPVVWHQSLLVFVQRYKQEIRSEDKVKLLGLLKVQFHYKISEEVRRELTASRSRGEKAAAGVVEPMRGVTRVVDARNEALQDMPPVLMMDED